MENNQEQKPSDNLSRALSNAGAGRVQREEFAVLARSMARLVERLKLLEENAQMQRVEIGQALEFAKRHQQNVTEHETALRRLITDMDTAVVVAKGHDSAIRAIAAKIDPSAIVENMPPPQGPSGSLN